MVETLILIGITIFCFVQGYVGMGVICLFSFFTPGLLGKIILISALIFLINQGHWIVVMISLLFAIFSIGYLIYFQDQSTDDI